MKTAIITGGSRGIGRAISIELASKGYNIVINYAGNENAAIETQNECIKHGVQAIIVKGNVASNEDCTNIVQSTIDAFGQVDVLVNNAGITKDDLVMKMSEEAFEEVLDVNLKGTFLMSKAVTRPMMKKRFGRIINVSSVVGLMGNAGQANYAASKAGVIGLTKSMARELASRSITVNAVAPGFIETDMTASLSDEVIKKLSIPLGTLGQASDVASAVSFLVGSSYITGQVLSIDGGMNM